ncbi:DCTN1 protein, partial [Indicator maculatus]|nr:DCTN1 protein [Indicator maculatus]
KDSPLLLQQIDALQLSIKHLKNENNRLKGAQMKMELASLAPLQVPKVSLPKNRQGEGLATQTLYRKSSQLLETLYQMSANAKVLDMKQNKSAASPLSPAARSSSARLLEQTARLCALKNTIDTLRDDTMRETVQQQMGASVPTNFGIFPSSSFLKAKREQEEGLSCYGRVTFPCPPGHGQAHRLLLTPDLLHGLREHFGP